MTIRAGPVIGPAAADGSERSAAEVTRWVCRGIWAECVQIGWVGGFIHSEWNEGILDVEMGGDVDQSEDECCLGSGEDNPGYDCNKICTNNVS